MTDSVKKVDQILSTPVSTNVEAMAEYIYELVMHLAYIKKEASIKQSAEYEKRLEKLSNEVAKTHKTWRSIGTSLLSFAAHGVDVGIAVFGMTLGDREVAKVYQKIAQTGIHATDSIKTLANNWLAGNRVPLESLMQQYNRQLQSTKQDDKNLSHESDRAEKALETIHRAKETMTR